LLEQLAREALDQGPPQNQEIFSLVKENWRLLDRPASARTTHVVVLVEDASRARQARLLAERLRARVLDASAPDDFIQRALAVPAEGFQVRAERLPPVAADGRVTEQDPKRTSSEPFDQSFAQAANSLEHPGDISPVTHSKFGFHVILLEERLPARKVETQELRRQLAPEVYSRRAALARQRLLGQLSRRTPVEMQRSALALTEQIGSTP
jgi:peptidyl-prolyl cis-trans isomerase C